MSSGIASRISGLRPTCAALLLAAAPFSTSEAFAHASDRGHVLLLPTGYYAIGGAVAVAASFVALAFLPATLPARIGALRLRLVPPPEGLRVIASLAASAVLTGLLVAGFTGSRDPLSNPLPLVVWTLLWIGLTLVQGLAGDLWAWINPWYGPWRVIRHLTGRTGPLLVLPDRVGWWPAIAQFLGFAWFELVYPAPDDPWRLALVAAIYATANFAAMLVFGFDAWSRRGECLSAFWRLLADFAPIGRKAGGQLEIAMPGARLADAEPLPPSGALFLILTLASVSFDGLSKTFTWIDAAGFNPLEYPGRTALIATNSAGLAAAFLLLAALFLLCVWAGERIVGRSAAFPAAGLLVWSIVPIALAYHFAHYLTAFVVNGQYALVALSDPLSRGWDLFGAAGLHVSPGVVMGSESAWVLWNLQAGAIIVGHVLAVLVAHGLSHRLHASPEQAAVSQIPLTLMMIGYTLFGLWLLSTPTAA